MKPTSSPAVYTESELQYKRYPGLPPFKRSQSALFCGRDEEISKLYNIIRHEPLMVVFGRSGTGKSSLLNAGLCPALEENGFLPLNIRVQPLTKDSSTPKKLVLDALSPFREKIPFPEGYTPRKKLSLWEVIKTCKFPFDTTPVLIFDQFEELFNASRDEQKEFLYELAEIVHTSPPNYLLDWLSDIPVEKRNQQQLEWCKQPLIRVMIAIRSDRFYEFNQWGNVLPQILRSCVELIPLTKDKAREAILGAAETLKVPVPPYCHPFTYDDKALNTIVDRLSAGKNYVETSYLQILCSELEDKLMQPDYKGDKTKVTEDDIRDQFNLDTIIDSFYNNQLAKLKDETQIEVARTLLEEKLVTNKRRRLLVEDQVLSILAPYDFLLQKLQDLRLIRGDIRDDQKLYEISHDILLDAISKSADIRQLKKIAEETRKENERKQAELESELKKEQEALVKEKRLKGRQKIMRNIAIAVSLLCIFSICQSRCYLSKAKKALGNSIFYSAGEQFSKGNHWEAFRLYQAADKLTEKDSLRVLLEKTPFALIAGSKIEISNDQNWLAAINADRQLTLYDCKNGKMKFYKNVDDFKLFSPGNLLIYSDTGKRASVFLRLDSNETIDINDTLINKAVIYNHQDNFDTTNRFTELSFSQDGSITSVVVHETIHFYSIKENKIMDKLNKLCNDSLHKYKGVKPSITYIANTPALILKFRVRKENATEYIYFIINYKTAKLLQKQKNTLYTEAAFRENPKIIYFQDDKQITKFDFTSLSATTLNSFPHNQKISDIINDSLVFTTPSTGQDEEMVYNVLNTKTNKYLIQDLNSKEFFNGINGSPYITYYTSDSIYILDALSGVKKSIPLYSDYSIITGTNLLLCTLNREGVRKKVIVDFSGIPKEIISLPSEAEYCITDRQGIIYYISLENNHWAITNATSKQTLLRIPFPNDNNSTYFRAFNSNIMIFESGPQKTQFIFDAYNTIHQILPLDSAFRTYDYWNKTYHTLDKDKQKKYGLSEY